MSKQKNNINAGDNNKMTPIEKAWDWNNRCVPEDGYDLEEELKWLFGKEIMLKKDFTNCAKRLLKDLYKEIKHGDKKHQLWLKNKVDEFINKKV